MKIGLDVHNVITLYPDIFSLLSKKWTNDGHEIHIVTGQSWDEVKEEVDKAGVKYDHHFSIVDYHKNIGTEMKQDENGRWWMDSGIWVRSKGEYIRREGINLHFDDSLEYAKYVPEDTTYVIVPKKDFCWFEEIVI